MTGGPTTIKQLPHTHTHTHTHIDSAPLRLQLPSILVVIIIWWRSFWFPNHAFVHTISLWIIQRGELERWSLKTAGAGELRRQDAHRELYLYLYLVYHPLPTHGSSVWLSPSPCFHQAVYQSISLIHPSILCFLSSHQATRRPADVISVRSFLDGLTVSQRPLLDRPPWRSSRENWINAMKAPSPERWVVLKCFYRCTVSCKTHINCRSLCLNVFYALYQWHIATKWVWCLNLMLSNCKLREGMKQEVNLHVEMHKPKHFYS